MKSPEFYNGTLSIATQKFHEHKKTRFLLPLSLAMSSLILGFSIYLLSRETSNILYQIAVYAGFRVEVDYLRELVPALPSWFVYSLPDGLWMFSFSVLILLIWDFKRTPGALVWISLALITAVITECLQTTAILPGHYDGQDLAFISLAAFLPLCFTHKSLTS